MKSPKFTQLTQLYKEGDKYKKKNNERILSRGYGLIALWATFPDMVCSHLFFEERGHYKSMKCHFDPVH